MRILTATHSPLVQLMVIKDKLNENKFMVKTIPLYDDDLIFLDVLPELHPDFIEKSGNPIKRFPKQNFKTMGISIKRHISPIYFESQRYHGIRIRAPP